MLSSFLRLRLILRSRSSPSCHQRALLVLILLRWGETTLWGLHMIEGVLKRGGEELLNFYSLVWVALAPLLLDRLPNNKLFLWLYQGLFMSCLTSLRGLLILLLEDSMRDLVH